MKLYLVAGEASGDNHGAALMQALRALQPDVQFFGRGGPRMREIAGDGFRNWIEEAAVVGLWEVLKRYPYFLRAMAQTVAEIAAAKPDAVVLIDYPGFNLRLARRLRARSLGGKIIYYISPQVWAWNRGRIPKMARWLDLMLCIFPFEAELYEQSGLQTVFVGHPLLENLEAKRVAGVRDPDLIGLFPGSRAREVDKLLPIMIDVMRLLRAERPGLRCEIAAASPALAEMIGSYFKAGRAEARPSEEGSGGGSGRTSERVKITTGQAAELMQRAAVGLVASGTATLEAAFFRMPFLLLYKVAGLTFLAGKLLVRVKHLGMPNVLAHQEIVPEFIQGAAQPGAIAAALGRLLDDPARREEMRAAFAGVIGQLGKGSAKETAAHAIIAAVVPRA